MTNTQKCNMAHNMGETHSQLDVCIHTLPLILPSGGTQIASCIPPAWLLRHTASYCYAEIPLFIGKDMVGVSITHHDDPS